MAVLGYITLTLVMSHEDDVWVGVCQELGVSTFSDNLDELLRELKVLVAQHLASLEKNKSRVSFFKKHGIHVHKTPVAAAANMRVPSGAVVTRLTEIVPDLAIA